VSKGQKGIRSPFKIENLIGKICKYNTCPEIYKIYTKYIEIYGNIWKYNNCAAASSFVLYDF